MTPAATRCFDVCDGARIVTFSAAMDNTTSDVGHSDTDRLDRVQTVLLFIALFTVFAMGLALSSLCCINEFTPAQVVAWLRDRFGCEIDIVRHELVLDDAEGAAAFLEQHDLEGVDQDDEL